MLANNSTWFLKNALTSGIADFSFAYGSSGNPYFPLIADWDGDGAKTPAFFDRTNKQWYLRNSNTSGFLEIRVAYGFSFGFPIAGDWDGDGVDTVGMAHVKTLSGAFTDGCEGFVTTWYLRNSNTPGVADETFDFGCPGTPLVGDWDGDGDDTPGLRRWGANVWTFTNSFDGTTDVTLSYGTADDFPLVGDWDGDGDDTIGVRQWNVWALRNSNTSGVADSSFAYGSGTHRPLVWGAP